jgi:hypothetical protein
LLTAVVFGAALLGAIAAKVPLRPNIIPGWRDMERVIYIFVLIVFLKAIHSFIRTDQPLISILGLIGYLTPAVTVILTYAFAATGGSRRIHSFLVFYAVCAVVGLGTVYLETSGLDLPIFGEVGVGLRIYDRYQGVVLAARSGIFRASEIAAWHAATCASVIVILMTHRRMNLARVIVAIAIVGLVIGLGVLTGRRKFIVMIAIFGATYAGLIGVFLNRFWSVAMPALLAGIVAYLVFLGFEQEVRETARVREYDLYVLRTRSVFGDIPGRFVELGVAPITWAYNYFGLLGGGAGIGSQGVQHLAEFESHIGAAEGGLGKIMLELGLPGLVVIAVLGWTLYRHCWRLLRETARQSSRHTRLACGLVALLVANAASFSVAAQAYGDLFILLFLGVCFGALLAVPTMVKREMSPQSLRSSITHLQAHEPLTLR